MIVSDVEMLKTVNKKELDSNITYTQWSSDQNLSHFSLGNVLNENPFYLGFALLDDVIAPKLDCFPQY